MQANIEVTLSLHCMTSFQPHRQMMVNIKGGGRVRQCVWAHIELINTAPRGVWDFVCKAEEQISQDINNLITVHPWGVCV